MEPKLDRLFEAVQRNMQAAGGSQPTQHAQSQATLLAKQVRDNKGGSSMHSSSEASDFKRRSRSESSWALEDNDDDFSDYDDGFEGFFVGSVEEDDGSTHILNDSDEWMINPRNSFRSGWDLFVILPLLVYLAIALPFRLCFVNDPSLFSGAYWFEFALDIVFIVDIALNLRTGYLLPINASGGGFGQHSPQQEDTEGEDEDFSAHEDAVEYDRTRVFMAYLKSWLVIDIVSGVPLALAELLVSGGKGSGNGALKSIKSLKLLRFLKLGRLLKAEKILSSLDRDTQDDIHDFLWSGSTRTMYLLLKLCLVMSYVNHIMACGMVVVGKVGSNAGVANWLENEQKGPFFSKDTTGANGTGPVFTIYVAAYYFCLTTMTSVGYGDIVTTNTLERLYVIALEFIGAIVFATVIGSITAVRGPVFISLKFSSLLGLWILLW